MVKLFSGFTSTMFRCMEEFGGYIVQNFVRLEGLILVKNVKSASPSLANSFEGPIVNKELRGQFW